MIGNKDLKTYYMEVYSIKCQNINYKTILNVII